LKIDLDGNYIITESNRVIKWNEESTKYDEVEVIADNLNGPFDAVAVQGGYLIVDTGNSRVLWWPAGATSGQSVAGTSYDKTLDMPRAVLPLVSAPSSYGGLAQA